VLQTKKGNT